MSIAKPTNKLTPDDWEKHPIWTFDLGNEAKPGRDETWMIPIKKIPVANLRNCGCLANASLACGRAVTVVLWGVKLQVEASPKELQYSIWVNETWWGWHK